MSPYSTVLWSFFSMWSMNKYFTVAVCCNRSKKRLCLSYCCFPIKSHDRKKWEVLCKRSDKKFKRLIDPRICSLHFKETDIAITISSRKNIPSGCYSTICDPTKAKNTTSARSKGLHNWKRCWAERPKPSRAEHWDFSEQRPREKNSRQKFHIQSKTLISIENIQKLWLWQHSLISSLRAESLSFNHS